MRSTVTVPGWGRSPSGVVDLLRHQDAEELVADIVVCLAVIRPEAFAKELTTRVRPTCSTTVGAALAQSRCTTPLTISSRIAAEVLGTDRSRARDGRGAPRRKVDDGLDLIDLLDELATARSHAAPGVAGRDRAAHVVETPTPARWRAAPANRGGDAERSPAPGDEPRADPPGTTARTSRTARASRGVRARTKRRPRRSGRYLRGSWQRPDRGGGPTTATRRDSIHQHTVPPSAC